MKIKVLKLGQAAKELDVPAGTTVEEAINMSGFSIDGYSVALNGTGANLSAHVKDGLPIITEEILTVLIYNRSMLTDLKDRCNKTPIIEPVPVLEYKQSSIVAYFRGYTG